MKKPVILVSVLIFSLALVVSSLTWADKEEGSGTKATQTSDSSSTSNSDEYKDKKHSEAGYKEEGSGAKQTQDKSAEHKKMEEVSNADTEKKAAAPKREGS